MPAGRRELDINVKMPVSPGMDVSTINIRNPIPSGEVLTDLSQKKWKIGKPIGQGSFGDVYLASDDSSSEINSRNARFVIKVEPHTSGPLFVEIHCLIAATNYQKVTKWMSERRLQHLGIPMYIASGSHTIHGKKYRFIVIPRFYRDLQKLSKTIHPRNILILAKQILDILEFLHAQGYTHCDIKSSNLMIGFNPSDKPFSQKEFSAKKKKKICLRKINKKVNYRDASICSDRSYQGIFVGNSRSKHDKDYAPDSSFESEDECEYENLFDKKLGQSAGQCYLLDYGIASKFINSDGTHKEFHIDQRKAHDGTLLYSSRDSHVGAHSRRSDLENLAFNIIDWLTGNLPWSTSATLADPEAVHNFKKEYMHDIEQLMKFCFKSEPYPEYLKTFLSYINKLDYSCKPDYDYCRNLFIKSFKDSGYGLETDMVLNFESDQSVHLKRINYSKKTSSENKKSLSFHNRNLPESIRIDFAKINARNPCSPRNVCVINSVRIIDVIRKSNTSANKNLKSARNLRSMIKTKTTGNMQKRSRRSVGRFGNFLGSENQYSWAEIIATNPENLVRANENRKKSRSGKAKNPTKASNSNPEISNNSNILNEESLYKLNPTDVMKHVLNRYQNKLAGKLTEISIPEIDEKYIGKGYTPAMVKILAAKEKREIDNCKNKWVKPVPAIGKDAEAATIKKKSRRIKKIDAETITGAEQNNSEITRSNHSYNLRKRK